jgi:hypothetical protein
MIRRKHRRDKNNGKNGWVSGNPRYKRKRRRANPKDKTMKGL